MAARLLYLQIVKTTLEVLSEGMSLNSATLASALTVNQSLKTLKYVYHMARNFQKEKKFVVYTIVSDSVNFHFQKF